MVGDWGGGEGKIVEKGCFSRNFHDSTFSDSLPILLSEILWSLRTELEVEGGCDCVQLLDMTLM